MKKFVFGFIALVVVVIALAGAGSSTKSGTNKNALPQIQQQQPGVAAPKTAATSKVSTCDVVREALLTGTQAEINTAMSALKADTTADATAREYADYYLNRDKVDAGMRQMDVDLIRTYCSL